MIELSQSCLVNKYIPKKTFYEKLNISSSIKEEFINTVDKIIWLYKLSEDTLGIAKTEDTEEIEIFKILVKEKKIPKNVIKTVTRKIPYKILFIIEYNDEFCYVVKVEDLYFSQWNEKLDFNFTGIDLQKVYENIVKIIIKETSSTKNFYTLINDKCQSDEYAKKIEQLKNKIRQEKQFNKKVELNQKLREIEKEMEKLRYNENESSGDL